MLFLKQYSTLIVTVLPIMILCMPVIGEDADLYVVDCAKNQIIRITEDEKIESKASWHPNGTTLLYSSTADKNANKSPYKEMLLSTMGIEPLQSELMQYDFATKTSKPVAGSEPLAFEPDYSPDGNKIVYSVFTSIGLRLRILDLNTGVNLPLPLPEEKLEGPLDFFSPLWSPDGAHIVCLIVSFGGHGGGRLLIYDVAAGQMRLINLNEIQALAPNPGLLINHSPTWYGSSKLSFLYYFEDDYHPRGYFRHVVLNIEDLSCVQTEMDCGKESFARTQTATMSTDSPARIQSIVEPVGTTTPPQIVQISLDNPCTGDIVGTPYPCPVLQKSDLSVMWAVKSPCSEAMAVNSFPHRLRSWAVYKSAVFERYRRAKLVEGKIRGYLILGLFGEVLYSNCWPSGPFPYDVRLVETENRLELFQCPVAPNAAPVRIAQWAPTGELIRETDQENPLLSALPKMNPFTAGFPREPHWCFLEGTSKAASDDSQNMWLFVTHNGQLIRFCGDTKKTANYIDIHEDPNEAKLTLEYHGPDWSGILAEIVEDGVTHFKKVLFPTGTSIPKNYEELPPKPGILNSSVLFDDFNSKENGCLPNILAFYDPSLMKDKDIEN